MAGTDEPASRQRDAECHEAGDDDFSPSMLVLRSPLQVEHTVTEAVTGVDIVQTRFGLARGETLREFDCRVQAVKAETAPLGAAARFRVDVVIDPADTRAIVGSVIRQGRATRD